MAADFVLNSGNAGSKHPLLLRRLAWTCSVVDVPVLDQPVSAHPQSPAWLMTVNPMMAKTSALWHVRSLVSRQAIALAIIIFHSSVSRWRA
jgi:hypothetical protein